MDSNQFPQQPVNGKPKLKFNFNIFSIATIALALTGFIGCFLPWAEVSAVIYGTEYTESANIAEGKDIVFFIILFVLAIVTACFSSFAGTGVAGVFLAYYSFKEIDNCKDEFKSISFNDVGVDLTTKIGFYVTFIASLAIVAVGVVAYLDQIRKLKIAKENQF